VGNWAWVSGSLAVKGIVDMMKHMYFDIDMVIPIARRSSLQRRDLGQGRDWGDAELNFHSCYQSSDSHDYFLVGTTRCRKMSVQGLFRNQS
jgi:hypothetical protein